MTVATPTRWWTDAPGGPGAVPVPRRLLARDAPPGERTIAVLGAGLSGLLLACELIRNGERGRIVLVDARVGYDDDRAWSFWCRDDDPIATGVSASWRAWEVVDRGRTARSSAPGYAYRQSSAADVYRDLLDELARSGRVRLRLGERVRRVDGTGRDYRISTDSGEIAATVVVDARGPDLTPETVDAAGRRGVWLAQRFVGLRVRAARPVFDPSVATLMAFGDRDSSARSADFLYLLPYSPTHALVESVSIGRRGVSGSEHRRRVFAHLRERCGLDPSDAEVVGEERGIIPMTDSRPAAEGHGPWRVGLAGGAARPSSGYAFLRIRRQAQDVARGIVGGRTHPRPLDPPRRRLLDAVMLRFLADRPGDAGPVFRRMFADVDSAATVRFLTDRSSLLDDLRLIVALPPAPFLRALGRVAWRRVRPLVRIGPVGTREAAARVLVPR